VAVDAAGAGYADPLPSLSEMLAEAGRYREGDLARIASRTCDAWRMADAPLTLRLVRLAWVGPERGGSLPPFSESALWELVAFVCDCHRIPRHEDLSWRLGILTGRAS